MSINLFQKIKIKTGQLLIRLSNDRRPDSNPFISGDGFRKIADHIYDETQIFLPQNVDNGSIVFVKSDMLEKYFIEIHPQIKNKYKLISHNSDINITEEYKKYLDDKIIHWFAQNLMFENKKVSAIPIGIENMHYYINGITKNFIKIRKQVVTKKPKILFGFNVETNPIEREKVLKSLRKTKNAEKIKGELNNYEYLKLLNRYMFVASPPGNGVDCHRTWEAIILGVVPVCLKNKNTELFLKNGCPIKMVDDFSDLENITEKELITEYQKIISNSNKNVVNLDHWKKTITS